ncbi:MAG TPA: hypothetical protein VH744_02940, partial [Terriglobales bacterium]
SAQVFHRGVGTQAVAAGFHPAKRCLPVTTITIRRDSRYGLSRARNVLVNTLVTPIRHGQRESQNGLT